MEDFGSALFVTIVLGRHGRDISDKVSIASEDNDWLEELSGGVGIIIGKIDFSDGDFAVGV